MVPSIIRTIGPSVVRTVVPFVVGFLLTWAAKAGLDIKADTTLTDLITLLVSGGYYAVVRIAEQDFPAVGKWLLALGLTSKQPTYGTR